MRRRTSLHRSAWLAVATVAIGSAACRGSSHEQPTPAVSAVLVQTTAASVEPIGQIFEVGGEVRALQSAAISSRIVAAVTQVHVKAGDRVHTGQVLVTLDGRDLQAGRTRAEAGIASAQQAAQQAAAERQAAEAALALASATHQRILDLRRKNSATASEMDEAEAALRGAQARLEAVDAQRAQAAAGIDLAHAAAQGASVAASYATLTAPFDGVITQKLIDAGNMALPGTVLVTMEDARTFRLEVRVDESHAPLVAPGQHVEVRFDGGEPVTARVAEIARLLDPTAHAFVAKLDLPPVPGLRSGMFGRARFAGPARQSLAVPDGSIVRRGQLTSVFVVERGTARLRLVSVGESADGRAEIRAGLDPGEVVVVDPPPTLVDGMPVTRASAALDRPLSGTQEGDGQ